jgi:DNA-binding transcriptional MerR regulator
MDELTMTPPAIPEIAQAKSNEEVTIDLAEIAKIVPDKMAFKIGEVADIAGLKPYVLRYWETEFDALSPQKSAFNQRVYSRRDVETVLLIKKLLYEEKFSIAGAKRKIRELRRELKAEKNWVEVNERIDRVAGRVEELLAEIDGLRTIFSAN